MSNKEKFPASQQMQVKRVVSSPDIEGLDTEEREEYLRLIDYLEFLNDPEGWYVKTEHPSLDG